MFLEAMDVEIIKSQTCLCAPPQISQNFFSKWLTHQNSKSSMSKKHSSFWGSFSIVFVFVLFFISVAWQQALWSPYRSGMVIFELHHRAGSGIAFDLFGSKSLESA